MSLYQQAIASRRNELLMKLAELEREEATARAFAAGADDVEREGAETWCSDVAEQIEAARESLDEIDECGFWRDRL